MHAAFQAGPGAAFLVHHGAAVGHVPRSSCFTLKEAFQTGRRRRSVVPAGTGRRKGRTRMVRRSIG